MSINYYYRYNICKKCGRYDELHLGQNAGGWKFLFRAHSMHPESYKDLALLNWEDWSIFMASNKGKIYNEYGQHVKLDGFLQTVTNSMKKGRDRITTYSIIEEGRYFQDEKGYWFYRGEFC